MSARVISCAAIACLAGACAEVPDRDVATLTTNPNSAPESETQTPPPDPTSGGGAKIAEGPLSVLLAETARKRPPPELFEFVGYVPVLTPEQHALRMRARDARRAQLTTTQYEAIAANESAKDERDAARMVIVSADGRMFRERVGAFPDRPRGRTATALPTHLRSRNTAQGEDLPSFSQEPVEQTWGSDGRDLALSSSHPWRAFASLRLPDTDTSNCSAGMIMPRVAVTSAHCVSPDGDSLTPHQLAPGARGPSYSNDFDAQYPFGRRFIEWYVWPNGWHGQDAAKYDYAVVIMRDINWSPGYIYIGKRNNIAYTHHWNQQYPGNNHACADAPASANGKCGGFRYTQYENVRTAGDGYFYHEWDTNGGSSGSPMYYSNGDDYRMIFGHNEGELGIYNTATRIMNWTMDDFICPIVEGDFQYEVDGVDHTARSKYFDDPECN